MSDPDLNKKKLSKLEIKVNFSQADKVIYRKSTANIIITGKTKFFPSFKVRNKTKISDLTTFIPHCTVLEILSREIRKE